MMKAEEATATRMELSIVFALALGAGLVAEAPSTIADVPTCHGERATIVGTVREDSLRGTSKPDVIVARGGSDLVDGLGGDDMICGGAGGDSIDAGGGANVVYGGGGSDTVWTGTGDDALHGGRGDDWLISGAGDDIVWAGRGASDTIQEAGGSDVIDGGPGTGDVVNYGLEPAAIQVDLAAGTASGQGSDTLSGIEGIWGTPYDDVITGDGRPNQLQGWRGDDVVSSGGGGALECAQALPSDAVPAVIACADVLLDERGNDAYIGGDGLDVVQYFNTKPPVKVDLGQGAASGQGTDTLSGIEGVWGTIGDDTVIGDDGDNLIVAGYGNDVIDGGAGRDLLAFFMMGAASVDLSQGTGAVATREFGSFIISIDGIEDVWAASPEWGFHGPDTLVGDEGANDLRGFAGADRISGVDGDDRLDGGKGHDVLDGGAGTDTCLKGESVTNCES
jgi:Ca2+-binding RTX toxin-like protein